MRKRLFGKSLISRQNVQREPLPATLRHRPLRRAPVAKLVILDDGSSKKGEVVRLRRTRHIIGRDRGDTLIPHDLDISHTHAAITCRWRDGAYRWHLVDLQSTNGTFLRVSRGWLRSETELLIGARRYLFSASEGIDPPEEYTDAAEPKSTHRFQNPPAAISQQLAPHLVELSGEDGGRLFAIDSTEVVIGRDPDRCHLVLEDDPFVSPEHACIRRDEQGRWVIEDLKSTNGVLLRVSRTSLERETEFQLGEQRFRFRPAPRSP